jgi:hypothetical protein
MESLRLIYAPTNLPSAPETHLQHAFHCFWMATTILTSTPIFCRSELCKQNLKSVKKMVVMVVVSLRTIIMSKLGQEG